MSYHSLTWTWFAQISDARRRTLLAELPNAVSQGRKTQLPKFGATLSRVHQLTNGATVMWSNQVWPHPLSDKMRHWSGVGTTEGDPNTTAVQGGVTPSKSQPPAAVMGKSVFLSPFGVCLNLSVSILQAPGRRGNCLCLLPGSTALLGKICEIPPPGQKPWLFVNMPRVEIWHFHNDMTDFHLGKLPSVFTMNLKLEWKIFHFVYKTI